MEGDDDIVITGISGRFAESDNVEELAKHLYAGKDLITEDNRRWPPGLYGLPKGNGKLKSLSKFDAEFFRISGQQAQCMDPQARILLEVAFESIVDAGYNVKELSSTNTGVFAAASSSDAKDFIPLYGTKSNGYEIIGVLPGFFANRISHALDFKGPSYTIDNGCASSLSALTHALTVVRSGQCNAAIVASANLSILPYTDFCMHQLHALSPESRCKTFTSDADGYVRSEAVVAVFIQKRSAARRVYATIRAGLANIDGYKLQGFSYPSKEMQKRLAEDTYKDASLRPQDVAYVEAHGTATRVGDSEELSGIVEFFCKERKTPLLIGSVKSNIGHTEPASGLCSIVKVLLAMECGVIPGNLHYNTPNPEVDALLDGRLKVVDTNLPWEGGLASINNFGFGGSNAHVILESKSGSRPLQHGYSLPRIIVASGRTKEAVQAWFALAQAHPKDIELHALLDAVHAINISEHPHRGYALLGDQYVEELSVHDDNNRQPIWFIFTGSFTQWIGSAQSLLHWPIFRESIENSAAILRRNEIDLMKILTEVKGTEEILNSTVGLVAIHIALVDLLRTLNIKPDGNLGHSTGVIGSSYSSGIITAHEALLCACLTQKYNCDNTIEKFERIISNGNIQLDSGCNEALIQDCLLKIIQTKEPVTKILEKAPKQSIIVEFGYQEISQCFLNRSNDYFPLLTNKTDEQCRHLLTSIGKLYNAGAQSQISHLYQQVKWPVSRGTPGLSSHVIWNHRTDWKVPHYNDFARVNNIVIDFDLVKPEHAFISGHNVDGNILIPVSAYLFYVWCTYANFKSMSLEETTVVFENVKFIDLMVIPTEGKVNFEVSILSQTGSFEICSHNNLLIATGIIRFVPDYSHEEIGHDWRESSHDKICLTTDDIYHELKLRGYYYDGLFRGILTLTANPFLNTGTISWNNNWISFIDTLLQFDIIGKNTRNLYLPSQIEKIVIHPKTVLQYVAENKNIIQIFKPQDESSIETVGLKVKNVKWSIHKKKYELQKLKLEKYVFFPYDSRQLSHYDFPISRQDVFTILIQIVVENVGMLQINICEIASGEETLLHDLTKILEDEPKVRVAATLYTSSKLQACDSLMDVNVMVVETDDIFGIPENNVDLLVVTNIITKQDAVNILKNIASSLATSGMILLKECRATFNAENLNYLAEETELLVVSHQVHQEYEYILLRVIIKVPNSHQIIEISSCDDEYEWVDSVRDSIKHHNTRDTRIYLVSYDFDSGLLGMANCLQREVGGNKIRVYFLPGVRKEFKVNKSVYAQQVAKDLAVNVLRNGVWGSYRHLRLEADGIIDKMPPEFHLNFPANKSYVLVGGLGGVGLELSNRLVTCGVTKLVLNSRSNVRNGYQSWCIRRWQEQGVEVLISNKDASTLDGAVALLQEASNLGSVGGIFNLAAVLEDAMIENQSPNKFKRAAIPKIKVTRYLDVASRELAPQLDHFVVFSSLSCGRGNYGQMNYGYVNSAMERIMEQRKEDGLAGLAIQWGPIGDVGILVNTPDDEFYQLGTLKQKISSCLDTLEALLMQPYAVVASCVMADKRKQVENKVNQSIYSQIGDILGIPDPSDVSQSSTLTTLGMDSIMAPEVQRVLEINHGIHLTINKINNVTFADLKMFDEEKDMKKCAGMVW